MAVDHARITSALEVGISRFLPAPVQFEVVFVEVEQLPVQDFFLPEVAMSPDEFTRQARRTVEEFAAADRVTPAAAREVSHRLVELAQVYEDVRFVKASGSVGGTFRPGTVTVYLTPGLAGEALSTRIISALAHETYHAASFKLADRRRSILRQNLSYQDERGYAVLEEIMACFFTREVCGQAGCPREADEYSVNREFLRFGQAVLSRVGLEFEELNRFWLLSAASPDRFWGEHGDTVFRGLHLMAKA